MALGAQKSEVLRLVIGRSTRAIEVGIITGIALDVALSMFLSSLFQGLRLLDPGVLLVISVFLTLLALSAAYISTRKALRLEPAIALRSQ